MPGQYSAADVDSPKGQFSAADVDPAPSSAPSLWQAATKPLGRPFDAMVRDKISALAGEHLPPSLAGPVAGVANAVTAIPASMVEFGRQGTSPLAVATEGASLLTPALTAGAKAASRGIGAVADSPVARWLMGYRLSKVADILGSLGDSISATSKAAKVTAPNMDMSASGIESAPRSFGPPIPDASQPAEKDILSQMTPAERTQLQKEIDDWVAGEGKERLKAGVKGAAPDYVKLPAGWKIGDPVPEHYTGAEGTPNEADFEDLLKQSLQGRGVKVQ